MIDELIKLVREGFQSIKDHLSSPTFSGGMGAAGGKNSFSCRSRTYCPSGR